MKKILITILLLNISLFSKEYHYIEFYATKDKIKVEEITKETYIYLQERKSKNTLQNHLLKNYHSKVWNFLITNPN